MFHDERFHLPDLKKSNILNLLGFIQALSAAIALFIIPLYLFEIFQSGEIIGNIISIASIIGIITTLLISTLLSVFSRFILFKIGIVAAILSIVGFLFLSNFFEAASARSLFMISGIILVSILSLYIKDVSEKKELSKNQGIYGVSRNLAWIIGPISAGFIFNFLKENKIILIEKFSFLGDGKYLEYNGLLYIAFFLTILTFLVFIWGKFINNHPHLQKSEHSKKNEKHYHLSNFKFIGEYFSNKYRVLSFLNILFLRIWFSIGYGFVFILLLEDLGIDKTLIGIIFGCISIPLVLVEGFFGKIIKKMGGSLNSLILGWGIFIFFLSSALFIGYENFYLFIFLFISAQIGIAIIEPLQELQYFEGVNKEEESKFYSIHMVGGALFRPLIPLLFGIGIALFGVQNIFYIVPFLFIPFFIGLIIYKLKFENKNI